MKCGCYRDKSTALTHREVPVRFRFTGFFAAIPATQIVGADRFSSNESSRKEGISTMLKTFKVAAMAATLIGMAGVAHADPLPNLTNLDFSQYTGSAPKGSFTSVNPVGWTGGNGLIF